MPAPSILHALAGQPITHDTLDALPPGKSVEHPRSVLVAINTLPARDEQLARLQRWITNTIAARANPDEQHLLRRYAIWHVLPLRGRLNGADTTHHIRVSRNDRFADRRISRPGRFHLRHSQEGRSPSVTPANRCAPSMRHERMRPIRYGCPAGIS